MSLKDLVNKIQNENIASPETIILKKETKEEIELRNIKQKLNLMDYTYFRNLVSKITFHAEQFEKNKTVEHEYLMENARLEFEIAELRYNGYKAILDKPENIKKISYETKKNIAEKEEQRKVLLKIINSSNTQMKI